jgi:light-regulated signal transduction histidine kinase (bacteriophytochrome)
MHDTADESLAASAAHQLGQGVALLRAYTTMVREAGAGPPDAVRGLEELSRRLSGLDDALLDLARLSRRAPVAAAMQPSEALDAARGALAHGDEGVVVQANPDPLPGVHADREHLERLFLHALRRAARSSRRLSVAGQRQDGHVHFFVGEERASHDLRSTARGAPPRRPVGDLGVEVCRRIVEAHEGELWLDPDSRSLSFTLPAAAS